MGTVLRFDDPTLLRVAWVTDVLHNCGQLFDSSAGTADTYELSSQADCIQVFISHTWALERKRKFLALALHFNLDMAIVLATAVLILGTCLAYVVARQNWSAVPIDRVPFTCTGTTLTLVVVLLFGHEGQAMLGFKGKSVFVDKACIHQTNQTLKERGIISLGAFLHNSEALVVCFTESYLKRLWTVYEFASFLLVHGETPGLVDVMPVTLPELVLASTLFGYCAVLANRVAMAVGGRYAALTGIIGYFVSGGILVGLARWWARQRLEARHTFKEFALANASCSCEADRALVEGNIIALMRQFGRVDADASDEDALLAFNGFVRTCGARAFVASVGHLGVPYKLLVPVMLTASSHTLQSWSAAVGYQYAGHRDAPQIVFMLIAHLSQAFTLFPLGAALGLHLAKCFPRLRGAAQVLYCGAVTLVSFGVVVLLNPTSGPMQRWLLEPALASVRSCVGFVLYSVALFALTACVYRQPQRKVDVPAAPPESAGSALPVGKPDVGTVVEASCEVVGASEVAEEGTGWQPEVAVAIPNACKVDLPGLSAEACSVPPTLRRLDHIIEAPRRIVAL